MIPEQLQHIYDSTARHAEELPIFRATSPGTMRITGLRRWRPQSPLPPFSPFDEESSMPQRRSISFRYALGARITGLAEKDYKRAHGVIEAQRAMWSSLGKSPILEYLVSWENRPGLSWEQESDLHEEGGARP